MSTKPNHRRNQKRFQDNGPRWEGSPNQGGHGISKGRKRFKNLRKRKERRKYINFSSVLENGGITND